MVAVVPFFGEMKQSGREAHGVAWQFWSAPLLLGLLGLVGGIAAAPVLEGLVLPAAAAIAPPPRTSSRPLAWLQLLVAAVARYLGHRGLVFWTRPVLLVGLGTLLDRWASQWRPGL